MNQEPEQSDTRMSQVRSYYDSKMVTHGPNARGVDWSNKEGQDLRFEQISKLFNPVGEPFSLIDLGCGYGALLDYLRQKQTSLASYIGLDISGEMISAAVEASGSIPNTKFILGAVPDQPADYAVASGTFNVKLGWPEREWQQYVWESLDDLNRFSRVGFAVNFLSTFSQPHRRRDDLFYADPISTLEAVAQRYSRRVALIHDYDLFEFTLIVRKP